MHCHAPFRPIPPGAVPCRTVPLGPVTLPYRPRTYRMVPSGCMPYRLPSHLTVPSGHIPYHGTVRPLTILYRSVSYCTVLYRPFRARTFPPGFISHHAIRPLAIPYCLVEYHAMPLVRYHTAPSAPIALSYRPVPYRTVRSGSIWCRTVRSRTVTVSYCPVPYRGVQSHTAPSAPPFTSCTVWPHTVPFDPISHRGVRYYPIRSRIVRPRPLPPPSTLRRTPLPCARNPPCVSAYSQSLA